MQLLTLFAVVFAGASVLFALQNNTPASVSLLFWRFDSTLALLLLIAMALGALAIAFASTPSTLRRQWTIQRQRRRIEELERELRELRESTPRSRAEDDGAAAGAARYVGLKQIVAGEASDASDRRE